MHAAKVLLVTTVTVALAGCTRVGSPLPPMPEPVDPEAEGGGDIPPYQEFGGRVWLGGEEYDLVLEVVRTAPGRVFATLRVDELSMRARGEGTATPERISLELQYGDQCQGVLRLEARLADGGYSGEGTLEAADCTGREAGPVTLLRRVRGAPGVPPW